MDVPESSSHQQRRRQMEEGMWAVLRPFFSRRAEVAAAAGSGLWKAPHVSQSCQWDCGVSCVQMVLKGLGRDVERSSLLASLGTRSVWTIDLAMLLHRHGVRFTYGTRTAGVTEAYSTIEFYRGNFDRDAPRVQALFKAAEEAKVGAVQKAFSWQELAVLVSNYNYAAIVLVDSRYLYPTAYRSPATAPALTPSATVLAPPSPAGAAAPFVPPSPSAATVIQAGESVAPTPIPSWSTPKRHREETEEDGDTGGWWGPGDRAAAAASAVAAAGERSPSGGPSRRRRKRQTAAAPIGGSGGRSSVSASPARDTEEPNAVQTAGTVTLRPSPVAASFTSELDASAVVAHAEASPSPPAVLDESGEAEMTVPATPPAPARQSCRKSLATSPGGTLQADVAGSIAPAAKRPAVLAGSDGGRSGSGATSCCSSPRPAATASEAVASPSPPPPQQQQQQPEDSSYCGHYILLVGWSEADGVFIARDPALPSSPASSSAFPAEGGGGGGGGGSRDPNAHVCIALTPEALDRARRSYGTDEDVLVVDLARSRRGGVPTAPLAAAAAVTALATASSSAAAASAVVGLLAMAAAAAAAGAEASGFKEWAWPDRAWFGGTAPAGVGGESGVAGDRGDGGGQVVEGRGEAHGGGAGAESAARRLASLISERLAASGLRFPTVGDAYRVPWQADGGAAATGEGVGGGRRGAGSEAEQKEEHERWAVRMASAMLLEGGRRAAYTVEGLLQGGRRAAYTMEGFLQGGAHTMEGLLQGGAFTVEGLLQGGRRAAYTVEGLLEGGRRAAYNLRDQLADVADAPGGAGAESCAVAVLNCPGSPVSPVRVGVAVVSQA